MECSLEKRIASMKRILPRKRYYAFTLTATGDGRVQWATQTEWVGFHNDDSRQEIRQASTVIATKFAEYWKSCEQEYVVVNTKEHLNVFLVIGGNALVENRIADRHLAHVLKPDVYAMPSSIGFESAAKIGSQAFRRAQTPKRRMEVIKRDDYRCMICGRRPADNVDIQLHTHHIRPWEAGGITDSRNMITLCHTCHIGLAPHHDPNLFDFIGEGISDVIKRSKARLAQGVNRYRALTETATEDGSGGFINRPRTSSQKRKVRKRK